MLPCKYCVACEKIMMTAVTLIKSYIECFPVCSETYRNQFGLCGNLYDFHIPLESMKNINALYKTCSKYKAICPVCTIHLVVILIWKFGGFALNC